MGTCSSTATNGDKTQQSVNKKVEDEIKKEKERQKREMKLLLLGTATFYFKS
jgi:hypothetical protein